MHIKIILTKVIIIVIKPVLILLYPPSVCFLGAKHSAGQETRWLWKIMKSILSTCGCVAGMLGYRSVLKNIFDSIPLLECSAVQVGWHS